MSDTRIKDIVTEASDYADDDYLVMDGLTNGTRKVSAEKIAGAKVGMFGDAYDDTLTYPLSSYCIYNDTVYINIDPVTSPEPFDSTKWEATTIDKELLKRYPIQRILKDDYDDLSYEEKNNGTIYIILDEDSPEDTLIWDTIGRGTLEIGDDIIDGVNELNQSLVDFGTWEDVQLGTPSAGTIQSGTYLIKNSALHLAILSIQWNGITANATVALNVDIQGTLDKPIYGWNSYNNRQVNGLLRASDNKLEVLEAQPLARLYAVFPIES